MKKRYLVISASVLLVVSLALSGFGCQRPVPPTNDVIPAEVTAVSTPTPIPTVTAVPTVTATVTATPIPTTTPDISGTGYTNQTYGYNFVYGPGWYLSQYGTADATAIVNFTEGSGRELAGSEAKIEIAVVSNNRGQSLEDFVESQLDYAGTTINRREMELVGGAPAYWVQVDGDFGITQTYYVQRGANFFLISLYSPSLALAHQQAYDALVASFTFVR